MPGLGIGPGTAFRQDILAARPPAVPSLQGYFFFATDVNGGTLYQCTGSGWVQITNGVTSTALVAGSNITLVPGVGTITINSILPIASGSALGGIKVGPNLTIDPTTGVLSAAAAYSLPIASGGVLGGIKVGANLSIDGGGVLSGAAPYTLPIASGSVLGGIKVGSGLAIDGGGVLSTAGGGGGMSFQGAWSGSTAYSTNDVVVYQGTSYIATAPVTVSTNTEAAYQTLVLSDSPVAFWPLTESGTSIGSVYADVTGNGYNVVVKTGNVTHTTGIFPLTSATTAPLFNSNDALWTGTTLGLPVNGSAYSLEGWMLPQKNFSWMAWIAYGPTNYSANSIGSDMILGRTATIETNFPANFHSSVLSFNLNTNRWRHVVWTDDGAGNVKLYVDKVLIQSFSGSANNGVVYNVANVLFLGDPGLVSGSYPAPLQEAYKGGLSHMAIYNVALTLTQITNHYNAGALLNPSPDNAPSVWTKLEDDANYVKTPAVKVYNVGNQTITAPSTFTLTYDSVEYDVGTPNGHYDGNTTLFAYETGYYEIYAAALWSGTTGTRTMAIVRSPSNTIIEQLVRSVSASGNNLQELRITMFLNAGEGVSFQVAGSVTSTLLALKPNTCAISPVFQMVKLD